MMEREMQKIENNTSEFNIEIDALKKENKILKHRVKILDENVLTADGLFDKEIEMKPGMFIFMPKDAPHSLKAQEDLAILLCLTT